MWWAQYIEVQYFQTLTNPSGTLTLLLLKVQSSKRRACALPDPPHDRRGVVWLYMRL